MVWIIGGAAALMVVLGVGAWMAWPSIRSMFGPGFEPTYSDDETVFQVQQKFTPGAGS